MIAQTIKSIRVRGLMIASVILSLMMTACTHGSRHNRPEDKIVVIEDSLSEDKRLIFDSLKYSFKSNIIDCMTASDLESDCGDHDAGGFDISFMTDIDTLGHVIRCDITGENICGANRQKIRDINKCIIRDMTSFIFPQGFRNMKLKFTLKHYVRS
jgi:hypothetical protein